MMVCRILRQFGRTSRNLDVQKPSKNNAQLFTNLPSLSTDDVVAIVDLKLGVPSTVESWGYQPEIAWPIIVTSMSEHCHVQIAQILSVCESQFNTIAILCVWWNVVFSYCTIILCYGCILVVLTWSYLHVCKKKVNNNKTTQNLRDRLFLLQTVSSLTEPHSLSKQGGCILAMGSIYYTVVLWTG